MTIGKNTKPRKGLKLKAFVDTCEQCGSPGEAPYECPYKSELFGDNRECSCCPDCEYQCALDI